MAYIQWDCTTVIMHNVYIYIYISKYAYVCKYIYVLIYIYIYIYIDMYFLNVSYSIQHIHRNSYNCKTHLENTYLSIYIYTYIY